MVLYMTILTYSSDISNPWLCFVSQAVVLFAMGGQVRIHKRGGSGDLLREF